MNKVLVYCAIFAIAMMVLQNFLTYFQYKKFQKTAEAMRAPGLILGVGMRKGGFNPKGGAIVILAVERASLRVAACQILSGITFLDSFKVSHDYDGLTLEAVRDMGIAQDLEINKKRRETEPYRPELADQHRKKGALIQAVEAIDLRLKKEAPTEAVKGGQTIRDDETRAQIEARKREIRKLNSN